MPAHMNKAAVLSSLLVSMVAPVWAIISACSPSPSASVDAGDLMGVFEPREAGTDAVSADASKKAQATKPPKKPAQDAGAPAEKPIARPPAEGVCVAAEGLPNHDLKRVVGRPACRDAQVLEWRDADGSPRYACVFSPKNVETRAPLPVILFFHGAYDDPTIIDKETTLRKHGARFSLTGDPAHTGFIVLAVQGRAILGGRYGTTFDTDYTGTDNVDIAAADHFLQEIINKKLVDKRRVYTMGNSWGARMAITYAMVRADRVAAFAVYGTDAPPAKWTCPGPPPPGFVAYRACDSFFPCESVERWLSARESLSAETASLRLGSFNNEEPHCALRNKCPEIKGAANHRRWPKNREIDMLRALARHTLSIEPEAPPNSPQ